MAAASPLQRKTAGTAHVGISGWNYPAWKRRFYAGIPQRDWLAHCMRHFNAIELNATFYRFLRPELVAQWRSLAPAGFAFALKGHRFITHNERLVNTTPLLHRMKAGVAPLGDRLAVVLWQLPQNLPKDLGRLDIFADLLDDWSEVRHAFEFRNPSWFDHDTETLLARRRFAVCLSAGAEWPMWHAVTTDLVYVRLNVLAPDADLGHWARSAHTWCAEGREVHLYLDGDPQGDAPYQAMELMRRIAGP
ncbi:MAG: DUF72 domain-containing protein [Rhodospirillales bacterium]|nr:DUF72 domain-containing protein [Rhodospirillales bacterium]